MIGGRFIYITRIQGLLFIEGCEEAGCIIYWKCHSHHVGILANKSRDVTFSLFILLESRTSACAWCFICICFICSKVHLNTLLTTAGWKDDYCHLRIVRGEEEPSKIWFLCNSIEVLGWVSDHECILGPAKGWGLEMDGYERLCYLLQSSADSDLLWFLTAKTIGWFFSLIILKNVLSLSQNILALFNEHHELLVIFFLSVC